MPDATHPAPSAGTGAPDRALLPSADASVADWICARLQGWGTVASVVPAGYPAYARVLHPCSDEDGAPARWSDAAAATGRTEHPLMQWENVSTVLRGESVRPGWDGEEPDAGNLDPEPLAALLEVLGRHTGTGDRCWFCQWEGWGRGWDAATPGQPTVSLPGRDLLVFSGPLTATAQMGYRATPTWFVPQSPNLFWPQDRAWCVATEVDLDCTLVAGTHALVDDLLVHPDLEVWPVAAEDSLAADADVLNPLPRPAAARHRAAAR
ncbi:hypothetical protein [Quadrisphaera sp. DSM 44207]|uniref:hypothetical protein n=1 Tax=Quadrisphaera sp. DSM 44207 TaxID=1881057 RepID=UPI001C40B604|nr:hypothetical protein [Quadrisphaera sp. DSM 44207]